MTINNTLVVDTLPGALDAIFAQARTIFLDRQRKYGPSNIQQQGIPGVVGRMANDKLARIQKSVEIMQLEELLAKYKVPLASIQQYLPKPDGAVDESFEDSLLDVMNYAAIALMLYRKQWGLPFEEPATK